jgi:DNA uptake protein ComE-like DNA-binding protein
MRGLVILQTGKRLIKMNLRTFASAFLILLLAVLAGCTQQQQNTQDLKKQAADATAEAREKAEAATVEVKKDAKAVAEGIKEGWNRTSPLDLNTATREQLVSLPGVTAREADRVIAGRPYNDPGDLVTRHIIPKTEYDKIADEVTAKN